MMDENLIIVDYALSYEIYTAMKSSRCTHTIEEGNIFK
jgi:hypothetical protein